MTQTLTSPVGRFAPSRLRPVTTFKKAVWSVGQGRTNPEVLDITQSTNTLDRLITALWNHSLRRRWQRELRALDDRQLSDVGISRADAERAPHPPGFWI